MSNLYKSRFVINNNTGKRIIDSNEKATERMEDYIRLKREEALADGEFIEGLDAESVEVVEDAQELEEPHAEENVNEEEQAQDILEALDSGRVKLEDYDLSHWRLMHIGAQPVPPSLIKHWKHYFPNHQYDTNYGLSESIGPGCVHLGVENIDKVGAIGKPGFGWKVKIVDEKRNEVPQGEVGELAVKGPGVMTCYYNDEEATKEVMDEEGWLYTGDMAQMDEDGFIFLVDRKKDVIISGGENIYPVQIEDFLRNIDAVHDVAVIGIPDKRLGETTLAVIELKPDQSCTEEEVNEFCQKLPRYKRPHKIVFADIPRNPTGKIEKPKLREQYCGTRLVEAQNRS